MRGILIASPGMDMGCSEFSFLGIHLAKSGYGLWALDFRGQGHEQNVRRRGTRAPWRRWVKDVEELASELHKAYPDTPIYLTAQSTGNCVSMLAAADLPPGTVQGLILHSIPLVYLYPSLPTALVGKYVLRVPLRAVRFSSADGLSHDDSSFSFDLVALEEWLSSPLRVKMRGEFLSDCFELGAAARASLSKIDLPVLVQIGCQDSLADKAADPASVTERFVLAMNRATVEVRRNRALGHLVLREDGCEEVFEHDVKWLEAARRRKCASGRAAIGSGNPVCR